MACPGPPLCCDECCTHRLFVPEIEWSDNVFGKRCGRPLLAAPAVTASYRDGDFVYLVAEVPRLVDGVVRYGYYAEKWDKDGTREWRSDRLFTTTDTGFIDTDRSKATAITSDGSHCWVAIAENDATGGLSKVFRLDALDGDVLFEGEAGASDELTVYSLAPTGDNKCYIGHQFVLGSGFVSTWDDDTLTDRFGAFGCTEGSTIYASSIVPDGTAIYVGHTVYQATEWPLSGSCPAYGAVSRYDENRDLVWISMGGIQAKIAKVGTTIFVGCVNTPVYGALEEEWGVPIWFKSLFVDPVEDATCGMNITDIAADENFVWISACRHVVQTDHDGVITSSVPHVHEDDIPIWNKAPYTPNGNQVLTVAAMQDDTAVGSGRANLCEPDDPLEPDERTSDDTECDAFSPGCENAFDFCGTIPSQVNPNYCHVNECGAITTNGRFALAECLDDPSTQPPCSGPGIITYTDCDDVTVTESFTFSSECSSGGRTWTGTFDGGSVSIEYVCGDTFGPENVSLTIDGCSVTVDTATITCDGPLGYASMEFTFSGTCGECAINGCGAFGAESCEVPSPCGGCDSPPTTAFATVTSSCGAVNGATGSGDRDGDQYEATLSACGLTATLICVEGGFNISMSPAECFLTPTTAATGACDPFSWSASFLYINGGSCTCCATGSITVTFTE